MTNDSDTWLRDHLKSLVSLDYITEHGIHNRGKRVSGASCAEPVNKSFFSLTETAPMPSVLDIDSIFNFVDFFYHGGDKGELGEKIRSVIEKIGRYLSEIDTTSPAEYDVKGRRDTNKPDEEKNAFYLLGETKGEKTILRLDRILDIQVDGAGVNRIYEKKRVS